MQTKARVIAIDGDFAMVETDRKSACDGCHKAEEGGCSVCSMMGGDRKLATRAKNAVGARIGDWVTVESSDQRMLWYAVLVFILPILITILSVGIVSCFTKQLVWQVMGGVAGLIISFFGIYLYSKHIAKIRCDVEIIEIISNED